MSKYVFLTVLEAGKSKIKVSDLVSSEVISSGSLVTVFTVFSQGGKIGQSLSGFSL